MNPSSRRNESLAGFEKELLRHPEMEQHQTALEELDEEMEERFPLDTQNEQKESNPHRYPVWQSILGIIAVLAILGACAFLVVRRDLEIKREQLAALSNADHGATLEEFMANIEVEDDKYYALFDSAGNKLFEHTYAYVEPGARRRPDWREVEQFLNLAGSVQTCTEVRWEPGNFSFYHILDDLCLSTQINSSQLIIMWWKGGCYCFTPGLDGWPKATEISNFQRWCGLSAVRDPLDEILEVFGVQHEVGEHPAASE